MIIEQITSPANEKIKGFLKLKDSKVRKEQRQFMVEGYHLVHEAHKQGVIKLVLVTEDALELLNKELLRHHEVIRISERVAEKLSDVVHYQGVFALCAMQEQTVDYDHNILLLDNLQDPGNLGTLIRSAASFNFKTVVASPNTASFYNSKVLRATQGNFFAVALVKEYLVKAVNELKADGYTIIGTNLHEENSKLLHKVRFREGEKYALLIGNEAKGLSAELMELVDINVMIEMQETVESLNAGIAGSIIMYTVNNA